MFCRGQEVTKDFLLTTNYFLPCQDTVPKKKLILSSESVSKNLFFLLKFFAFMLARKRNHCFENVVAISILQDAWSWHFFRFASFAAKPSLKIGSVNKAFLFWYWQWLTIFLRNKTFLFFKTGSWNFQNLFEKEFRETSQNVNSIRQQIEKNEN